MANEWEQTLAEVTAAAAFDENGKMIGPDQHSHFGKHRKVTWSLQLTVYPLHSEPITIRHQVDPVGKFPVEGQQTFVKRQAGGVWYMDLDRIAQVNTRAAESNPAVAEALAAVGAQAPQLPVFLPGVPREPIPEWTPAPTAQTAEGTVESSPAIPIARTCPNCGAPLELTGAGRCRHCEVPISL